MTRSLLGPLVACAVFAAAQQNGTPPGGEQLSSSSTGATIPLSATVFEGGGRLTISANPPGAPPQELLLDTGSSTLAFCNRNLGNALGHERTRMLSCNHYGGNADAEGYWGYFYKGTVSVGGVRLDSAYFSVMEQEKGMPCDDRDGVQGIFGVAFRGIDRTSNGAPPRWREGTVGECPYSGGTQVGPIIQYLNGHTRDMRMGIYWSGDLGRNTGTLYLGEAAVRNEHYARGQHAEIGEKGYYNILIDKFYVDSFEHSVDICGRAGNCILDTGTPRIQVPPQIFHAMYRNRYATLTISLRGGANLHLDVDKLLKNEWVEPAEGQLILGYPLWFYYYTVFDIRRHSVEFVTKRREVSQNITSQATVVV